MSTACECDGEGCRGKGAVGSRASLVPLATDTVLGVPGYTTPLWAIQGITVLSWTRGAAIKLSVGHPTHTHSLCSLEFKMVWGE